MSTPVITPSVIGGSIQNTSGFPRTPEGVLKQHQVLGSNFVPSKKTMEWNRSVNIPQHPWISAGTNLLWQLFARKPDMQQFAGNAARPAWDYVSPAFLAAQNQAQTTRMNLPYTPPPLEATLSRLMGPQWGEKFADPALWQHFL